jgi:leucyl aminopeptidase (aminopeptidase T)
MMKRIEMIKGAKKLVEECTNVKEGENVVILTDTRMPLSMAEVLAIACKERGAEAMIIIISPPVGEHEWDPPPPVMEAVQKAQVVFFVLSRTTFAGSSRSKATKAGARCINFSELTEEDMFRGAIEVSFMEMKEFGNKLADVLRKVKEARITTPAGTDLYLDFRGRLEKVLILNGICHQPGEAKAINLEVAISPKLAQGTIVCDASITLFKPGLIKEWVRGTIKNGKLGEISGGSEAKKLTNILAAFNDPNVYNVVEFGVGFNPKAIMTGAPSQDRGVYGTCHIGFGSNTNWGGGTKAAVHFDFVLNAPKIEIDGVTLLENYKFHI